MRTHNVLRQAAIVIDGTKKSHLVRDGIFAVGGGVEPPRGS